MRWPWNMRCEPYSVECDIDMHLGEGDVLEIDYTVNTPWGRFVFDTRLTFKENNIVRYQNFGARPNNRKPLRRERLPRLYYD